jgi:inner membrane protein
MAWFTAVAVFPDIDLLPRGSDIAGVGAFAHRGATHSLLLAAAVGMSCGVVARILDRRDWLAFGLLSAAAMGSHDVLDAFSESDLRLLLLWPVSNQGYLAPWHPLPIPPLGGALFTERGALTAFAELVWFLPVWLYALWPRRGGRAISADPSSSRRGPRRGEVPGRDRRRASLRSLAAFASLPGTALIPASSGPTQGDRLNRGGNRQLNRALHLMARVQARTYRRHRHTSPDVGPKARRGARQFAA